VRSVKLQIFSFWPRLFCVHRNFQDAVRSSRSSPECDWGIKKCRMLLSFRWRTWACSSVLQADQTTRSLYTRVPTTVGPGRRSSSSPICVDECSDDSLLSEWTDPTSSSRSAQTSATSRRTTWIALTLTVSSQCQCQSRTFSVTKTAYSCC